MALNQGNKVWGAAAVNPILNQVLVTTGPLTSGGTTGGWYLLDIMISSTVSLNLVMEILDGSNNVVSSFTFAAGASSLIQVSSQVPQFILDGYSVRIKSGLLAIGTVQAAIGYGVTESN